MALLVIVLITYFEVIRREVRWAVRGAMLGAIVALVGGIVGAAALSWILIGQGEPPWIAIPLFLLGLCLPGQGALWGGFWGGALRRCVRMVRSLRIRARCRRRTAGWSGAPEDGARWNLADVDWTAAAEVKRVELARLLLRALADGAQVLTFAPLGRVCRLWQQKDGVRRELIPLRLSAVDLALELLTLGRPTQAGSEEVRAGKLYLQLGEHTADVSVILRLREGRVSGELRFPAQEGLAGPARQALSELQELLGDPWEESVAPVVLDRPKGGVPSIGGAATTAIRVSSRGPDRIGVPPSNPIPITFDGELLGWVSLRVGFTFRIRADVGNHLLQFDPGRRFPWTGRDYLVQIREPGRYEVRLRWTIWGMLHRRPEIVALPADKPIPAASPSRLPTIL